MDELIERLRYEANISDRPGQLDRLNALADEFADALEAARVDAERYRWLRNAENDVSIHMPPHMWEDMSSDYMDRAIDAAMADTGGNAE